MVKKLFKHEFLAYARVMPVIYIILLTIATAGRIIQFFENDSVPYEIISVFSGITYGVSVFVAAIFCLAFAVTRFYKNLFTHEGYLSFTLPVTAAQHIWVKVITAVAFTGITWVVILLSGCVITAGEMLTEIIKAVDYIWVKLYELADFHVVIIGLEFVVLLLVSALSGTLLYYTFISIGQLFKKNRVLAAVGAYFVWYIITQVISTVFAVVFTLLAETAFFDNIYQWIAIHPYASIHIGMWGCILLSGILAAGCFAAVRGIISKKLNLE